MLVVHQLVNIFRLRRADIFKGIVGVHPRQFRRSRNDIFLRCVSGILACQRPGLCQVKLPCGVRCAVGWELLTACVKNGQRSVSL